MLRGGERLSAHVATAAVEAAGRRRAQQGPSRSQGTSVRTGPSSVSKILPALPLR